MYIYIYICIYIYIYVYIYVYIYICIYIYINIQQLAQYMVIADHGHQILIESFEHIARHVYIYIYIYICIYICIYIYIHKHTGTCTIHGNCCPRTSNFMMHAQTRMHDETYICYNKHTFA